MIFDILFLIIGGALFMWLLPKFIVSISDDVEKERNRRARKRTQRADKLRDAFLGTRR